MYAGVPCSCGVTVMPPSWRVQRARLDEVTKHADLKAAVAAAAAELETLVLEGEGEPDAVAKREKKGQRKLQRTKEQNVANLSKFRNKDRRAGDGPQQAGGGGGEEKAEGGAEAGEEEEEAEER